MSHAPFNRRRSPKFFGLESFTGLPDIRGPERPISKPAICKWQAFPRKRRRTHLLGLTLRVFWCLRNPLTRRQIGQELRPTRENVLQHHETTCAGKHRLLPSRHGLTDSFAKFRWCPNYHCPPRERRRRSRICPCHHFGSMGEIRDQDPHGRYWSVRSRELRIGGRRLYRPLTNAQGSDNAAFFCQLNTRSAKFFGNAKKAKAARAELPARTPACLSLFIVTA